MRQLTESELRKEEEEVLNLLKPGSFIPGHVVLQASEIGTMLGSMGLESALAQDAEVTGAFRSETNLEYPGSERLQISEFIVNRIAGLVDRARLDSQRVKEVMYASSVLASLTLRPRKEQGS